MHADTADSAKQLFAEGRFGESAAAYRSLLAAAPENAEIHASLGRLMLLSNQLDAAETHLRCALALDPNRLEVKPLLLEVHYRRDDLAGAASLAKSLGDEARARQLQAFQDQRAYELPRHWQVVEVPFVRTDPLPVIKAWVNGVAPLNLLIDTGGGELILDREFAASIGVESFGSRSATYAGGQQAETGYGRVDTVQLGDLVIRNVPLDLLSTRKFDAAAGGARIDGVLGTVLLSRFRFTLDYPGGQLVLHNRTQAPEAVPGAIRIPVWLAGDHFIVAWGRVNDAEPTLLFVDTGLAGGGFVGPESTLEAAEVSTEGPSFEGIGGAGTVHVIQFVLDRLSLGDAMATQIVGFAGVFPESLEYRFGFRIGGIVSHQFLRPYQVTFDLDRMELILNKSGE